MSVCACVCMCVRRNAARRFDSFACLLFLWWIPPLSLILMQMKGSPGEMVVKIVVYHIHASESYLGHSYRTGGGDETCAVSGVTVTNALNEFTRFYQATCKELMQWLWLKPKELPTQSMVRKAYLYFLPFRHHNGSSNDLQQIKEIFRHNQT